MSDAFIESRKAIEKARDALRRGDRAAALKWGEEASRLAPQSEDPWLVLAAAADPRASVDYIRKALEVNPESARARRGMQWAMQRLHETPPAAQPPAVPAKAKGRRSALLPVLLVLLGCLLISVAAWSAAANPALASIVSQAVAPQPTLPPADVQSWAEAELPKPAYTPTTLPPTATPPPTNTPQPTEPPTLEPTSTAEFTPTPEPSSTPEATSTPGGLQAVIVEDTPTSQYAAPAAADPAQPEKPLAIAAAVYGERWIDVDLSQQRVYAYEGDTLMNSFLVSTGTWMYPTVTGTYKIWIKLRSTTMTGPGYYLPNVPYTMYFYKGYGLHGTYWHNNFGTPMSHGCVNLSIPDSQWLYNFASVGTTVNVHY